MTLDSCAALRSSALAREIDAPSDPTSGPHSAERDLPSTTNPTRRVYTRYETRESWLTAGVEYLADIFGEVGAPRPSGVRVSVGFPRGRRAAIGQCFASKASTDGTNHVFISPILEAPVDVLAVLCHELVHVVDDCRSGHRGNFARIAREVGLVGPMRATQPSEPLVARLDEIATEIGPYPHRALVAQQQVAHRPDTTRMLKVVCPTCGYLARTTRYWLELKGVPLCPDGTPMRRADQ